LARRISLVSVCLVGLVTPGCQRGPSENMSFFVTSVQAGRGGNLGGLAGADAHCQALAGRAGSAKRQWRAYLSAPAEGGQLAVHARDRIGRGPWFNASGVQIAANVEDLHGPGNALGGDTSLDERRQAVFQHDIMTGSGPDGTLADGDTTCRGWTSPSGHAVVGHSNKQGSCCGAQARSWNAAHVSDGCTLGSFQTMGGAAQFYCFATD
jgi:hypothetical protein